jgi:hypothetical protein
MPSILAPVPHGGHQCYSGQNSTSDYSSPNFSSSARAPLSQNSHRRPLLISETNNRSLQAQLPQRHQTAELHLETDARALHPPSRPILRSSRGRPPLPKRPETSKLHFEIDAGVVLPPGRQLFTSSSSQPQMSQTARRRVCGSDSLSSQMSLEAQTPLAEAHLENSNFVSPYPPFPSRIMRQHEMRSQPVSGLEPHKIQKPLLSSASYSQTAASINSDVLRSSSNTASFENKEWLDYLVSLRELPGELKLAKTPQQMDVLICKMHQHLDYLLEDAVSRSLDRR